MASWQAYAVDAVLRVTIKRKLRNRTDLARARAVLESGKIPIPADISYAPHWLGKIPSEHVTFAATAADAPVLLYLHGGGYFACSPRTHRAVTSWFARAGFSVFAPEYRLAPEHPYPAAVDDAEAAYLALLDSGHAAENIVLAGDSAGGGLALALLMRLRDRANRLPAAAALFSPWTDLAGTGDSIRQNRHWEAMFWAPGLVAAAAFYLGGRDPRGKLISPLYGDMQGLPPLLIHVGSREMLRDDSTRLAARARDAGVRVDLAVWPVVPHVWQLLHQFLPEGRQSLRQAADFLTASIRVAKAQKPRVVSAPVA